MSFLYAFIIKLDENRADDEYRRGLWSENENEKETENEKLRVAHNQHLEWVIKKKKHVDAKRGDKRDLNEKKSKGFHLFSEENPSP